MNAHHGHHGDDLHHQHDMAFDSDAGVALIELEGEVLSELTDVAVGLIRPLLLDAGVTVGRVVDLGCGPGVATCALAEMFEPAVVVAADSSAPMLARASARAARLGRSAQVQERQIDLDNELSELGRCDVVHASMALHHVRDEVSTLAQVRALVEPEGLVCLLERADPLRVRLAEECGRPGLWDRLDASWHRWFEDARHELPGAARAEQYPSMLASAGFDVLVDETVEARVDVTSHRSAMRLAVRQLERAPAILAPYADPADLQQLPALVQAISESPDEEWSGAIHATRKVLIAAPR